MNLTPEQQAILNGEKGEVLAKVMKTLVMYGDAFGAEKLVPVTSKYGHTVISFGINTMKPVYDLYDQLLASGVKFQQKFTADPLPLDPNVPSNLLQDLVFKQFMYKLQPRYEEQLRRMGMKDEKDFTCACYFDEVGNIPEKGEVLSWAESSAVVYANSVLGAQVYVVDDAELERVKASYPVIWKNPNAKPKLAFIGCPHLTMDQLIDWTKKLEEGLKASGRDKLAVPTVLTTAPPVLEEFNKGPYAYRLKKTGAILSYICPLMYMNNPLSKSMPVITCSNKLRTYTSAKFYSEDEIVGIITGKETK